MKRHAAGRASSGTATRACCFGMVELPVAIDLAGTIFAALVPFFAQALKAASLDAQRNAACRDNG